MRTKVHPNTPSSKSLRTTIPEAIVEFLGIQSGDSVNWKMEVSKDKRFVVVEKAIISVTQDKAILIQKK